MTECRILQAVLETLILIRISLEALGPDATLRILDHGIKMLGEGQKNEQRDL